MSHDKNRVSACLSRFIAALRHASKIFAKCCLPNLWCCRVVHKALVITDAFASFGMYHWHCNLQKIEAGGGGFCFDLRWGTYIRQICPNTLGKKVYGLLQYKVSILQPSFDRDKLYVRDPCRGQDDIWDYWDNLLEGCLWRLSWGNNWGRWWIGDHAMWCCGHNLRDTARYVVSYSSWMHSFTWLQSAFLSGILSVHNGRSISNPAEHWDINLVLLSLFGGGIHPLFHPLCVNLEGQGYIWC